MTKPDPSATLRPGLHGRNLYSSLALVRPNIRPPEHEGREKS